MSPRLGEKQNLFLFNSFIPSPRHLRDPIILNHVDEHASILVQLASSGERGKPAKILSKQQTTIYVGRSKTVRNVFVLTVHEFRKNVNTHFPWCTAKGKKANKSTPKTIALCWALYLLPSINDSFLYKISYNAKWLSLWSSINISRKLEIF